jgi:hypothetical protein
MGPPHPFGRQVRICLVGRLLGVPEENDLRGARGLRRRQQGEDDGEERHVPQDTPAVRVQRLARSFVTDMQDRT